MLLRVEGITRTFAGLVAVDKVSFSVAAGIVHAVIGPNGAGKTTLFNIISGLLRPTEGRLLLDDRDLTDARAHQRTTAGLARTFQNIRMFGGMSVLENVMTGMHPRLTVPWPAAIVRLPKARQEERDAMTRARALLGFVGIAGQADRPAADLSYGDQRRL